eukprot:scaffold6634_cov229-Ochromonas_danica.AAC.21
MEDPNLKFFSSLRSNSSNTSSKSPQRRSSLSVSSWHDPSAPRRHSAPLSSVRLYSPGTTTSATASPSKGKSNVPSSGPSTPTGESKVEKRLARRDVSDRTLWEPPVSCRRRLQRCESPNEGDYQYFFPIELSNRDYFHRLVALMAQALDLFALPATTTSTTSSHSLHPLLIEEFTHLLVANAPDYHYHEYALKIDSLVRQNERQMEKLMQTLLDYKSRLFTHVNHWGSSRLHEMSDLFRVVEEWLQRVAPSTSMPSLAKELQALGQQLTHHQAFQQERMSALGWKWHSSDSQGGEGKEQQEEERWRSVFAKFDEISTQASHFRQPQTIALLNLLSRLLTLEEDLHHLSKLCADQSEYEEAERLRGLALSMEATVSPPHRLLLDQLHSLLVQINSLVADMDFFLAIKQRTQLFQEAKMAESASLQLRQWKEELTPTLLPIHLLTTQSCADQLDREGSFFIDSNFLFLTDKWPDQVSLASLVIRAAAQDILEEIQRWPELTALKNSDYNMSLQQLKLEEEQRGQQQQEEEEESVHMLGTTEASAGPFDSSPRDGQNLSPSHFPELVVNALQAFDLLQQELDTLLTPTAIAHSQLLCRLIGISHDLHGLTEISDHALQPTLLHAHNNSTVNIHGKESDRLRGLIGVVEGAIDADELMAEEDPSLSRSLYGRNRLDYIWQVIYRIKPGMKELLKLKSLARSYCDFTAAAALESMLVGLETRIQALEESILAFSLLDLDNDIHVYDNGMDMNERIAREGTAFITSDFIFTYSCGAKGHSIGSLAIVAGAGTMLRYIKQHWPHLTALGNSASSSDYSAEASLGGGNTSIGGNTRKRSVTSSVSVLLGHHASSSVSMTNFNDAAALRLMGFNPQTLRVAGFNTVDILTAGYTAEQLKLAGFDAQAIHSAAGLTAEQMLFLQPPPSASASGSGGMGVNANNNSGPMASSSVGSGHSLEIAAQLLHDLFNSTRGLAWKQSTLWNDLIQLLERAADNFNKTGGVSGKVSILSYQNDLRDLLHRMHGIKLDLTTYEVHKLSLPQNNLQGNQSTITSFAQCY